MARSIDNPVRVPALLAVVLTAAMLTPASLSHAQTAPERPLAEMPVPVIRVSGEGKVAVKPDMAILNLGVVREADTAREALNANNEAMARIIETMKEAGVAGRDLQTSGFSIQPRYFYPKRNAEREEPPKIVGYTVSNQLTVRIRDLENLGAVIDRSVTLGANSNGNIVFANDDPSEAISSARAEAMKDARQRAETLARAAGAELGMLLEISENFSRPMPQGIQRARFAAEAADAAVPVESGENSYSVTVQASWSISQ
jgi:uncharacterized protein YggE